MGDFNCKNPRIHLISNDFIPYLSSNTPIASAKRPRISKKDNELKSPSRTATMTRGDRKDHTGDTRIRLESSRPEASRRYCSLPRTTSERFSCG